MLVPHTYIHTYIYQMSLKGIRKFKWLRLIFSEFTNVKFFFFFLVFVSIFVKATKHEEKCHIVNLIILFQLKVIS